MAFKSQNQPLYPVFLWWMLPDDLHQNLGSLLERRQDLDPVWEVSLKLFGGES